MRRSRWRTYAPKPRISEFQVVTRNFSQFPGGFSGYDLDFGGALSCRVVTLKTAHFCQELRVTTLQAQIRALGACSPCPSGNLAFVGSFRYGI